MGTRFNAKCKQNNKQTILCIAATHMFTHVINVQLKITHVLFTQFSLFHHIWITISWNRQWPSITRFVVLFRYITYSDRNSTINANFSLDYDMIMKLSACVLIMCAADGVAFDVYNSFETIWNSYIVPFTETFRVYAIISSHNALFYVYHICSESKKKTFPFFSRNTL